VKRRLGRHCFPSSQDTIFGCLCTSTPTRPCHCSPRQRQHRFLIVPTASLKGNNTLQRCQSHLPSQYNKTYHSLQPKLRLRNQNDRPSIFTTTRQQQSKDMLSSIFISALLAGPVVAGVIPRQNTITVKQIVTSVIATSTVLEYAPSGKPAAYSYSPSPSASTLPLNIPNGFAAEFGLNPINGLPAAPPQKAKSVTTAAPAPAPSSTTIKPMTFSTINGSLQPIYKSGPARTFAVPAPSSSSQVPKKLGSSASSTAPLVFRTFTSAKGDAPPTAINSPKPTKSAAASSPTLTRLIQTSSAPAPALPSAYSSLLRAPPQFPSVVISKKPVRETSSTVPSSSKPTTTSSKAPAPAPPAPTETQTQTEDDDDDAVPSDLAALFSSTSSEEATNPYPYPTAQPKKPKPSNYTYPYPPKE
jgi:hypothetical protein